MPILRAATGQAAGIVGAAAAWKKRTERRLEVSQS